jgi:glycosyltransferase involved in cell wall biosynthesis
LIVVDTGSTDQTVAIAKDRGAKVREMVWDDDFASARNISFDQCTSDWIMWLDADDVLPNTTKDLICGLKEWLSDDYDAVSGPYHYIIASDGTVQIKTNRERLIRREANLKWEGSVHEVIPIHHDRLLTVPELIVEHRPNPQRRSLNEHRNIRILEREIKSEEARPRTWFYYGNELYDHGRWEEAASAYRKFLSMEGGFVGDRYWAFLFVAESARQLGEPDMVRRASLDAIAEDPSRAEAFVSLGRYYFDSGEWEKALPPLTAATACTTPGAGLVRNVDYLYVPWDLISVCMFRLGRFKEALAAADRALPGNPEAERVRANMRSAIDNF